MSLWGKFLCWTARHKISEDAGERLRIEYREKMTENPTLYLTRQKNIDVNTHCLRCKNPIILRADVGESDFDEIRYWIVEPY